MKKRSEVAAWVIPSFLAAVCLAGCKTAEHPGTHTGDPLEPPWVMKPNLAEGMYPGPYVFGVGLSEGAELGDLLARDQAEANAKNAVARRLSELCSYKLTQWARKQNIDKKTYSSSEIDKMAANISVEFLLNCEFVDYWSSKRTGQYAVLARLKYTPALLKIRDEINRILAERLRDDAAVKVHRQALERELGIAPEGEG